MIAKIKVFLVILAVCFTFQSAAQDSLHRYSHYVFHHFSAELLNGFNLSRFTPNTGVDKPKSALGWAPSAKLNYTFNISRPFGITLTTGFGFHPFNYKVKSKYGYVGTEGWMYHHKVDYTPYVQLLGSLDYRRFLSDKWVFSGRIGGGTSLYFAGNVGIGSSSSAGQDYLFEMEYLPGFLPLIFGQTGIQRSLKNKNLLGLSVGYLGVAAQNLFGTYQLYDGASTGTIRNRGGQLYLSLSYTFTGAHKFDAIKHAQTDQDDLKKAKKEYRKQKREIHDKALFVELGSALFSALNFSNDDLLGISGLPFWKVYFSLEKGIEKNILIETSASVEQYLSTIRMPGWGTSGSTAFIGGKVSLGMKYRVIVGKYNYNLLNISTGMAVGFHTKSGHVGSGSGSIYSLSTGKHFEYSANEIARSNVFPTFYAGIEKDFQLSKRLYLSMGYRYDQGGLKAYSQVGQYSTELNSTDFVDFESNINGSAHTWSLGFKYRFDPKEE